MKPKVNMPSVISVVCILHCLFIFVFSFDTRCQSVNGPTPGDCNLHKPNRTRFH